MGRRTNYSASSIRRTQNLFLSETKTVCFAPDHLSVGLQIVYLFLQGQILVHEILDLRREAYILTGFFTHLRECTKINRNHEHRKYRRHDQERQPPRRAFLLDAGLGGAPAYGSSCGRSVCVTPVNICGLAQLAPPNLFCLRSLRKSARAARSPTVS